MSEGEVQRLSAAIAALSAKTDLQHADNQKQASKDRETFAEAMSKQRELFQQALNEQFLEHVTLAGKVESSHQLLKQCVGDGQPGEGKIGVIERNVELLMKFRWQATALITTALLIVDKADKIAVLFK